MPTKRVEPQRFTLVAGVFLPGVSGAAVLLLLSILAGIANLDSVSGPKPVFVVRMLPGRFEMIVLTWLFGV